MLVAESVLEALFSVEVIEALVGVGRGGFGFGPVVVERRFFLLSCCGGCEIAVGCDVGNGCGGRLARLTILRPIYRLLHCSILCVDRLTRTQLIVSGGNGLWMAYLSCTESTTMSLNVTWAPSKVCPGYRSKKSSNWKTGENRIGLLAKDLTSSVWQP